MSKKKTTRNKKDDQPEVAMDDATFNSDDEQVTEAVEEDLNLDAAVAEPSLQTTSVDSSQKKGGGFIAWLALFVAILALVAFAVDFIGDRGNAGESRKDDAAIASVTSSVRAVRDSIATLQQDVTELSDELALRDSEIAAIESRFSDRLEQIESLPGRLAAVEGTVSSLKGLSTGARDAWLLAEAEYYMQIANAQLQLAGNPHLAGLALGLADDRLLQMANPALTDVRRALALELRALDAMDKPDTEGVTLTLASLAAVVDSLPLKQEVALSDEGDTAALDPELTGVERALASVKNAIGSAINVRRVDEAVRPLIAPEAQYFLRANLALQLQAARLAMLRGEESIFRQSLDDAASWLTEYFDTESTAVQSALQTITEIHGSVLTVAAPDISESLRLLRRFIAYLDATTKPVAESRGEPIVKPPDEPIAEPPDEPVAEPEQ